MSDLAGHSMPSYPPLRTRTTQLPVACSCRSRPHKVTFSHSGIVNTYPLAVLHTVTLSTTSWSSFTHSYSIYHGVILLTVTVSTTSLSSFTHSYSIYNGVFFFSQLQYRTRHWAILLTASISNTSVNSIYSQLQYRTRHWTVFTHSCNIDHILYQFLLTANILFEGHRTLRAWTILLINIAAIMWQFHNKTLDYDSCKWIRLHQNIFNVLRLQVLILTGVLNVDWRLVLWPAKSLTDTLQIRV